MSSALGDGTAAVTSPVVHSSGGTRTVGAAASATLDTNAATCGQTPSAPLTPNTVQEDVAQATSTCCYTPSLNPPLVTAAVSSKPVATKRVPKPASASAARVQTGGRWGRVRDRFLSMFTATAAGGSGAGSSREASAPVARSRSKEELLKLLAELHEDVMAQVRLTGPGSVGGFFLGQKGGLVTSKTCSKCQHWLLF